MKIYRLETKSGRGVYSFLFEAWTKEDYTGGEGTRHPGPQRDSLFNMNHEARFGVSADCYTFTGKYVFGFSSPAQMLRWFFNRDDLALLEAEKGIRVSVYECDDVIEGNTQVAFGIWHHQLFNPIATYGLVEFYDLFAGKGGVEDNAGELPSYKQHQRRYPPGEAPVAKPVVVGFDTR